MIRIITEGGVSLDIDPSAEFEIEYENPMLDDSHLPVPFSTSIALLPTAVNCNALGYFPAMMLEPSVRSLKATIEAGGIPLLKGSLIYDSIEDGKLNYTFSGLDLETEWSKKIWQLNIRAYKGSDWGTVANEVISGKLSDVYAPLMINPSAVASTVYKDDDGRTELVEPEEKYMNCPVIITEGETAYDIFAYSSFIPVIGIDRILDAFPEVWSERPSFSPLAIVGRYPSAVQYYKTVRRSGSASEPIQDRPSYLDTDFDIAETLPDITMADLVQNLARIRCAAVYYDGEKLKYVCFNDVVKAAADNWDAKVSDEYSLSKESRCRYSFGFDDDDSGSSDSAALTKDTTGSKIAAAVGMSGVLAASGESDYSAAENEFTGDIYSGKYITFKGNKVYLEDMILHNVATRESDVTDDDASAFDGKVELTPVRTVPDVLYKGTSTYTALYRVAPLVPPVSADSDRDSKAYIGYVYDGQMSDSGYTLGTDGKDRFQGYPLTKMDYQFPGHLLSVNALWADYHTAFADWLSQERQCVTADLSLTLFDICNFRMYRPVYFRGRRWIARKLTLTFNAGSDAVSARGEFLSYDAQG